MSITLRPYQEEAVKWLESSHRCILADEMGLGKTYPAIEAGLSCKPPRLVIAPAYLSYHWKDMLQEYGQESVTIVEGSPVQKREVLAKPRTDWVISSYGLLARAIPSTRRGRSMSWSSYPDLISKKWSLVIQDEAHRLRGRNSLSTRATYQFPIQTHVWMLTGSPIVRDPSDIFPLLRICDRTRFTSYWNFVFQWFTTTKTPWATKVTGVTDAEAFTQMLSHYMLRRRIGDPEIDIHLDDPVHIPIGDPLDPVTRKTYDTARKEFQITYPDLSVVDVLTAGALISKLRQMTAVSPTKINSLLQCIEDLPNKPVAIFTWFRNTAQTIGDIIKSKTGRPVFVVTGAVPASQRVSIINELRNLVSSSSLPPVLVANIAALSEGVNLQFMSNVIFYEEDWLHETNTQALKRFHRPGQENIVQVSHIVARKTVDEYVHKVEQRRGVVNAKALLEEVMSG